MPRCIGTVRSRTQSQSINHSSLLNEYTINTWHKSFIQTIIIIIIIIIVIIIIKILHSEDGVTNTLGSILCRIIFLNWVHKTITAAV